MRRSIHWLVLVPALVACEAPVFGSRVDQGVIVADVLRQPGGVYAIAPEAVFYKNGILEASLFTQDTCAIDGGLPPAAALIDPVDPPVLQTVGAGNFVEWKTTGRTDSLVPMIVNAMLRYRLVYATAIPAVPAELVDLAIDGEDGGFAPATLQARLADELTVDPVVIPPAGSPLVVTWTPSGVPGSRVLIEFGYRIPGGGAVILRGTLRCRFSDTGSGSVPQGLTDMWRSTPTPSTNTYKAYRERVTFSRLSSRREVYVLSRLEALPITSAP